METVLGCSNSMMSMHTRQRKNLYQHGPLREGLPLLNIRQRYFIAGTITQR